MTSELKRNASRINGAKSRGAVTPEGRRMSTAGATKHGLLAKAIVIPGESADRLAALSARFHAEFRPRTEAEAHHVETMILCRWRLHRVWELETASLNYEIEKLSAALDQHDPRVRAAVAFRNLADNSNLLELLNRYETKFARAFIRAHQCLLELKAHDVPDWSGHKEQGPLTLDGAAEEIEKSPNQPEPDSNRVL